jgi:hypothetical protein
LQQADKSASRCGLTVLNLPEDFSQTGFGLVSAYGLRGVHVVNIIDVEWTG